MELMRISKYSYIIEYAVDTRTISLLANAEIKSKRFKK